MTSPATPAAPALPGAASGSKPNKKKLDAKRAWAEARDLMGQHKRSLTIGFSLMIVNRLAGLVLPASSKYLIDNVIGKHNAHLLLPLALAALAATVVQALTGFALSQVVSLAGQRAITNMRKAVQQHVLRLPVAYFDSTKTGILISRVMSDAEGVRNLVGTGIVQLVGGFLTAIIAVGVLLWLNWKLTVMTVVVLVFFGTMMSIAFKKLRPLFRERGAINAEVTGRLAESVGGIRTVKVYTAERRERLIFAKGAHRLFRNVASTITGTSAVGSGVAVITGIIGVLMIIVGGRDVLAGRMTLGDMMMYVFFIGMVAAPLVSIASIGTQITEAFAGLDRIREIRDMGTEDQSDAEKASVPEIEGEVEFRDVWFEYNPGVPVLKDISFHARAGTTTALVGSSGGGKSTLVSLVMAFNRPRSGRIYVDGRDLDTMRLNDFRSHLGVVMQDNFLFDGTIRENISYSKPGATLDEVVAAARIAHADEFIDTFTDRYDTIVGERGVKLSGGQRQRVAIARAILADPRILILDEATSSLDSESEAMIRDGLRSLRRGRTTFVIAHRLSTIESADQILVLEAGSIVERGTHHELMKLGGRYRELHDRQYGAERDVFINPGEDFIPVAPSPKEEIKVPARSSNSL
ncbi:MAG TPA: ABC transporter ATP-binding protein [Gemmatimonadaceae bacterium]|nr:ABC transporter ATP-binding protein [Gemmatimonadaceae bacterium]